jgi:hypothetical protein
MSGCDNSMGRPRSPPIIIDTLYIPLPGHHRRSTCATGDPHRRGGEASPRPRGRWRGSSTICSPAGERRVGKWRVLRIEGASVYFLSIALAAMNEIRPLADTDSDLRLSATHICIGSEQSGGLERMRGHALMRNIRRGFYRIVESVAQRLVFAEPGTDSLKRCDRRGDRGDRSIPRQLVVAAPQPHAAAREPICIVVPFRRMHRLCC